MKAPAQHRKAREEYVSEDFWSWVASCFANLPRSNDEAFVRLWQEGRLRFSGSTESPDAIDEWSARLVCATLRQRERLLIVLPDHGLRRPPLLFATGLIMYALECMEKNRPGGQVAYFGSTIGIRSYLSKTRVGNLVLDSVFSQAHTLAHSRSRIKSRHPKQPIVRHLPRVLCVYSPVDPVTVLEQHPADWLAIDCGQEVKLPWLPCLLKYAAEQQLPIVAWTQNSMSESIADFARAGGKVFRWPRVPTRVQSQVSFTNQQIGGVLGRHGVTEVTPVLVDGPGVEAFAGPLQEAHQVLRRASTRTLGRMGYDALRLGWKYLRALESLPVPLDLYEAEVQHVWGLTPISHLREAFRRFINAIHPSDAVLASELEEIEERLSGVLGRLQTEEPPLWLALAELCVSDVPEGMLRLLVFPSAARKQLFSFALLARYNITEDDLLELRIEMTSLADLRRGLTRQRAGADESAGNFVKCLSTDLMLRPLLVGLPSLLLSAYLEPVLLQEYVEVLIYPYQGPALACRLEQWNTALRVDLGENVATLSRLCRCSPPASVPRSPPRVEFAASTSVIVIAKKVTTTKDGRPLWQAGDPVDEVARLLETEGDGDYQDAPLIVQPGYSSDGSEDKEETWVDQAIEVQFDGGRKALFAPEERINVIVHGPSGDRVDERYIRSLQVNDRVLFIHGQQRQSLYELIISRVHRHPSIELHLALIRRWQQDFAAAYQRWRQHGVRNLEELLRQMQDRGSSLICPLTLHQWLRGQTLCPNDEQDLRRLAEILDLGFVRQYYRRISQAADRLRGLHRGLANRLNRWLKQQAVGLATASDDEIIDGELGLTFGDFRSSLLILRVVAIQSVLGPFMRSTFGRLEREIYDE